MSEISRGTIMYEILKSKLRARFGGDDDAARRALRGTVDEFNADGGELFSVDLEEDSRRFMFVAAGEGWGTARGGTPPGPPAPPGWKAAVVKKPGLCAGCGEDLEEGDVYYSVEYCAHERHCVECVSARAAGGGESDSAEI